MENRKRQSRFDRRNPPEALKITNYDVRLFLALYNYRYLRSTYIQALLGGEWTYLQKRLRVLYRSKYLARSVEQELYNGVLGRPVIYELDYKGEEVLRQMGLWTRDLKKDKRDPHHEFLHDLGVCDVAASIEKGANLHGYNVRHTRHVLDRMNLDTPRFPMTNKHSYVPDSLFGIEGDKGVILYTLEFDRGTEQMTRRGNGGSSYQRKFDDLKVLLGEKGYKKHFDQAPPMLALHVFTSTQRMYNAMEMAGPSSYNLFKAAPAIGDIFKPPRDPVTTLFTDPWQRNGHPPFSMLV